jgi:hypothetical protein
MGDALTRPTPTRKSDGLDRLRTQSFQLAGQRLDPSGQAIVGNQRENR